MSEMSPDRERTLMPSGFAGTRGGWRSNRMSVEMGVSARRGSASALPDAVYRRPSDSSWAASCAPRKPPAPRMVTLSPAMLCGRV